VIEDHTDPSAPVFTWEPCTDAASGGGPMDSPEGLAGPPRP